MPHHVTISDENFAWLQSFTVPLIDRDVNDVISRRIRPLIKGVNTTPYKPTPSTASTGRRNGHHRFGLELLKVLRDHGPADRQLVMAEMGKRLADKLSPNDWDEEPSGAIAWKHRVDATKFHYKNQGWIEDIRRGVWAITESGLHILDE